MNTDKIKAALEAAETYMEAELYPTEHEKDVLSTIAKAKAELENDEPTFVVTRDWLEKWYETTIECRPDVNIYKEGLISAYKDFSRLLNDGLERDTHTTIIRMRNPKRED